MAIVQINHRRPDMPKAEWEARRTDDRARQFLQAPGLLWKIRPDGDAERRAGGVCMFEERAAAEAYAAGPIVARLRSNPELSGVDVRIFDARGRMSEITRAPLPHRKAAAE